MRILTGLAAALALVLLLLWLAPARLLTAVLPAGQVAIQGASGSLWRGQAARVVLATPAGPLQLGALSWQLHPLSLLAFSPRVTLDSQWGGQRLQGSVALAGGNRIELAALEAAVPASLLRQFLPLQLEGQLSLQSPALVLEQGLPVAGAGRVVWQDAGWVSPDGPQALGHYVLEFEQQPGAALAGRVLTLSGPVQAEGSIGLAGSDYSIDLLLSGPGLADPRLAQALQLVAAPEGSGFRVRLQGSLPQAGNNNADTATRRTVP